MDKRRSLMKRAAEKKVRSILKKMNKGKAGRSVMKKLKKIASSTEAPGIAARAKKLAKLAAKFE